MKINSQRSKLALINDKEILILNLENYQIEKKITIKNTESIKQFEVNWREKKVFFLTSKGRIFTRSFDDKDPEFEMEIYIPSYKRKSSSQEEFKEVFQAFAMSNSGHEFAVTSRIVSETGKAKDKIYYLEEIRYEDEKTGDFELGLELCNDLSINSELWDGGKKYFIS